MGVDEAQPERSVRDGVHWSFVWLLVASLAIALWSVPRAIQAGDAGEFTTVALTGGVPHPSGYPWMRILGLLGRGLWALGLRPTIAAAIGPALAGIAAWLLIQRCFVALWAPDNARSSLGVFVVTLVLASPLVVIHVNDCEVWGPHLLFSALFIHTVISTRARPQPLVLGVVLGLAVSHHLTAVLLIPLAIGAATPIRSSDQQLSNWAGALIRNGLLGLAGSLIGLLPILTLVIGRGGGWRWGDLSSFGGFVHHVSRADYGVLSLSLHTEEVAVGDLLARSLTSVGEVFSAGLISSPIAGVVVIAGATAGAAALPVRRSVALGWVASIGASALAFPAMQNIDPTGPFGAWILERFDLLTVLLVIVPLVAGLGVIGDRLRERLASRPAIPSYGAWAIAAALVFAQLGAVVERGRPATERAVELAAIDMLETPDPEGPAIATASGEAIRAIVFGTDDHRTFPAIYAQEVLGAGAHTLYVDAELLAHPWYRARLRARVPSLPDVDKPLRMIGAIWSDPELDAVPIYLANVFSEPAARLDKIPEGMLWRIPPPPDHPEFDASAWTTEAIVERHLAAFARYEAGPEAFAGLDHPRGHPWSSDLWHAYVDKSRQLAATLVRAGERARAEAVVDALERTTGAGWP